MSQQRLAFVLIVLVIIAFGAGIFVYEPAWKKISSFQPWRLGLDLAGGSLLTYEIDLSKIAPGDRDSVVHGLRDVIERRVNLFGVSEPKVYEESVGGSERLVVELAGIRDVGAAIREIGETPLLDFREVVEKEAFQRGSISSTSLVETIFTQTSPTSEFLFTGLTGRYVKNAQVGFDSVTNQPQVNIQFNGEGARIFEELTERNIGKPLAIFLDDELIELPVVQGKISGGDAQITGSFTIKEARTLVGRFNAGALPAPILLVNQETIGPDFGADALKKAIIAGILGTLLVMVFMLVYYRFFGVFSSLALLMYVAITLGFFKILGVTITLAGIAGFVLSIGMAVDANILVFERTKEELKKGLSRTSAIQEGFRRAWTSIRDSNISTMITALVLYYFTSSFVRGFALTLFIGVVVSMFSAITITRTWLRVFVRDEATQNKKPNL